MPTNAGRSLDNWPPILKQLIFLIAPLPITRKLPAPLFKSMPCKRSTIFVGMGCICSMSIRFSAPIYDRVKLLVMLTTVAVGIQGYGGEEVKAYYERALQLSAKIEPGDWIISTYYGLWLYHFVGAGFFDHQ